MVNLVYLLPGLLIISALLAHLLGSHLGRQVAKISVAGITATFLLSVILLALKLSDYPLQQLNTISSVWGSLLLDPLSILMSVVISGISLIVHVYSVRYMAEESGYSRFFVLLDLMTASLLIMVAAGDMITLLVAWHLIGVLLYFLLGHDTRSHSAYRYAFWTFFTYRIGDLPLLLAAILLYQTFGTWSLPELFTALNANPTIETWLGLPLAEVVGALIAIAAFARSAQFLLHTWLPFLEIYSNIFQYYKYITLVEQFYQRFACKNLTCN